MKYKWSITDYTYSFVLFFSLCLILSQCILRIGLWGDESALANHYFDDYITFFQPLKSYQVAPLLFLLIEKTLFSISLFFDCGYDYFLRTYPFLCSIGSVILYYFTIVKYTNSKIIALFSFIILITSAEFIYYTSEVKQYICEFWCTILLLYVYSLKNNNIKYTVIFCITVLYCILSSHVICFALLPLGIYDTFNLLLKYKFNMKKIISSSDFIQYFIMYGISLLILITYYFMFLYNHPSHDFMIKWWNNSFITKDNFFALLQSNLKAMYPYMMSILPNMRIWLIIVSLGFFSLLMQKNKFLFLFSIFMIGSHLLFSYFKLYPVANRLVLYWLTCTSLFLGSFLYYIIFCICKTFCIISNLIKFNTIDVKNEKNWCESITCISGFIILAFLYCSYVNFNIPLYLHRAPTRLIYNEIMDNLKENDIVILHQRGIGKYEKLYIKQNKFNYRSLWNNSDELNKVVTNLKYDELLDSYANQIIDYAIFNKELDKYDRIWVTILDVIHLSNPNKSAVENRINRQIKEAKSHKILKECQIVIDTTICLIDNKKENH